MDEVLGFDCDGYEIEEFRILRFPFSADIENWDEEVGVDPRFYCIVKRDIDIWLYCIAGFDKRWRYYSKQNLRCIYATDYSSSNLFNHGYDFFKAG